jgi:asparagine synthase (glutamine-hydrolysing)
MPGITGIITNRLNADHRIQVDAMVKSLTYEDFYKPGSLVNEKAGVAVGWVSHAGSFSDCMPVWNENKTVLLVFTGEDYQDQSRIERLRAEGHEFDSRNATYLVHLYEELGLKFLEQINGWFSGLIVDLRENRIVLFNDRFGVGRICYHETEDGFYFSSEAKSLLNVLPHLRSLDLKSLGEVFSCGSVLQNRTLFSGVSLLPGGSVWSFSKSQPATKGTYFDPEAWEKQPSLGEADYYEQLKQTWQRILPRYLPGGERAGLSLTGGVDSRMILAWAPRQPGELPCYTFSGRYRDCNDVKLARRLAKLSQQPYHTIPIDGQFLSEFPSLAEKVAYVGEGNLDASGTIDLFVQREARRIAPIRVTGTNGGELLRRLVMFKPAGLPVEMLSPEMKRSTTEAASTYAEELKCHKLSFTAFKQTPWYMNSKFVVERSQITMRLPFCDNDLVGLSYQAPPSLAEANEPALRLIADRNLALGRIGTDRALHLQSIPGIGKARHLIEEFTFKAEYAYDVGMPQWLAQADHAVKPLRLENLFLGRHKFHHFRVYYRDELGAYLQEILLDPRTLGRPFLNRRTVEAMIRGHVGGYRNYTNEIHRLLTIELMYRRLIEQVSDCPNLA